VSDVTLKVLKTGMLGPRHRGGVVTGRHNVVVSLWGTRKGKGKMKGIGAFFVAFLFLLPATALADPGNGGGSASGPHATVEEETATVTTATTSTETKAVADEEATKSSSSSSSGDSSSSSSGFTPAPVAGVAPESPGQSGEEHGNPDKPDPKITICHATGSETNPFVVITISENGLHGHARAGHQNDEDVIPAGPNGECEDQGKNPPPPDEHQPPDEGVEPTTGGGEPPAAGVEGASSQGELPFTGLSVLGLAIAGSALASLGWFLRRRSEEA
jgi:hypothetical protein